ncbi:MAG TPA: hypothetical protein VLA89_14070 [Gemmatimonadales bacterium]|nr:hypothetical protein [Gemmatimonadales bacterium]
MGTIKSSENLELAEYLRSQRQTTQADVDTIADQHPADRARYGARERLHPAAH